MGKNYKYAMNAIHYCIHREEMTLNKRARKAVRRIMHLLSRYCLSKQLRIKLCKYLQDAQEVNGYGYDEKVDESSIGWVHSIFGFFYSCYPSFISWICIGIADWKYGSVDDVTFLFVFGIPVIIGYIPAYRAVFSNDIYLRFYKRFEKENEKWHKKWKLITVAFCIGGVLTSVIGFLCMATLSSL